MADPVLVTNERGGPVPPTDIVKRLKAVAEPLGLRFMPDFDKSRWALTWEWPLSDARWSRVQSNEIPRDAAYDIIGYLPIDCPVESAGAYVETHLKNYPRDEVRKLRERMTQWNQVDAPREQLVQTVAEVVDATMADKRQKNPRRSRVTVPKTSEAR